MGEITTNKYSEELVNEMAQAHKGDEKAEWDRHQTWKAIWINKVRILHAYKRQKTVLQGDMGNARNMIDILEMMNKMSMITQKPKPKCNEKRTIDTATQTEEWWWQNRPRKQG